MTVDDKTNVLSDADCNYRTCNDVVLSLCALQTRV